MLEKKEQMYRLKLPDEVQSRLKKIQEQREALYIPLFVRLKNWPCNVGYSFVDFLKKQVSWDWYFSTSASAYEKKVAYNMQQPHDGLSIPWYGYLWLPNIFAKFQDSRLKSEELALCNRLEKIKRTESKIEKVANTIVENQKVPLMKKLTALKSLQKKWDNYAKTVIA
jgi:hypothetical protein